jgi:hypothetical protein
LAYVADPLIQSDPLGLTYGYGDFDSGDYRRFSSRTSAGRCNASSSAAPPSAPYPRTRPSRGRASGSTSSSGPAAPPRARGPRDPASGRKTSQGGGTTSGWQVLDGDPRPGGSRPQPGELTDVSDLNRTDHRDYSSALRSQLDDVHGYNPDGSNRWIRGHLQNDNLGGPGISENMTPLTSTANKNMSGSFEGPLKRANDRLDQLKSREPSDRALERLGFDRRDFNQVRREIQNVEVQYRVEVSPDVKFPDSRNPFERSIRDYVKLDAEYVGLTPNVQHYIEYTKESNFLPNFLPRGTKMDTLTGDFFM